MLSIFLRRDNSVVCIATTDWDIRVWGKYISPTRISTGLYSIFVWCVAVICQHFDLKLLADIQDNLEMNPNTPLHEDTLNNLPPETPHQETQRCTRNSPCRLAGCTICPTPTNHVRNLDEELGTDDTNSTIPTTSDLPPPT